MAERRKRPTLGQAAVRACLAHPGEIAGMIALQLLARAAALAPFFALPLMDGALPQWAPYPAFLLIFALLVLPLRFAAGEKLRYASAPNQTLPRGGKPYSRWLRAGLARFALSCLWGLPFLLCLGYFLYGKANLPFNDMWMPARELARLIGKEPSLGDGLPVAGALVVIFAALFAYGWWRCLPAEYLPVRYLDVKKTWFFLRRARRRGRGQMRRNALINMLLTLPALLAFAAVTVQYVVSRVSFSSGPEVILMSLMRLTRQPLPPQQMKMLLAIFVVLYLPLMILRKMRNAVLIRRLTKECSHLGDEHAAG